MAVPGLGIAANTGSMFPTLKGGEIYAVLPAAFNSLKVGDVIVYYWPQRHLNVIHRIVAIRQSAHGRALVCKGDANSIRDPLMVTEAEFVGIAELPKTAVATNN